RAATGGRMSSGPRRGPATGRPGGPAATSWARSARRRGPAGKRTARPRRRPAWPESGPWWPPPSWTGTARWSAGSTATAGRAPPEEQPDHPRLACRAAPAMLDQLPGLNGHWQAALGEPMGLGIGVHTGVARVGNTGSRYKFKYGPLGPTANLASRVQGAA